MTMNLERKTVASTETSLLVLELVKERNGARLSDIVDEVDVSKSTAHKHLTTLRELGYLSKQGEIYQLGMKLWHLGNRARSDRKVFSLAEQAVERLADQTQEEAQFDVEENGQIISVFSRMGTNMEATFEPGRCFHLHTTATGKAILAQLSEERRDGIVDKWGLPSETEHTITTKAAFEEELRDVRRRGYAFNDEELRDGLRPVAGAVRYPDGHAFGGISVGGPLYRIDREYMRGELTRKLISVIEEMERKMTDVEMHV